MEIDITPLVQALEETSEHITGSIMELGEEAAQHTWENAQVLATNLIEDGVWVWTDESLKAFRDYVYGFGAWSETEITSCSPTRSLAFLLQIIDLDLKEDNDQVYKGDDGGWYMYLGV